MNKASSKRLSYVDPFAHLIMLFSSRYALNGSAWARDKLHSKIQYLADVTSTKLHIIFQCKKDYERKIRIEKEITYKHYTKKGCRQFSDMQ